MEPERERNELVDLLIITQNPSLDVIFQQARIAVDMRVAV
jgi:hypothetical protein